MARRYEDAFSELEERFPLEGERTLELPEALRAIAEHVEPVGTQTVPVEPGLPGRILAQDVPLSREDQPGGATTLPAGTRLGPLHLGLLAGAGLTEVLVRRPVRVALLGAARRSDEDLRPSLLQLRSELVAWGARVDDLGVFADDAPLFEAVAKGVVLDLLCVVSGEAAAASVLEAGGKLGSRTLFEGLLCRPGGNTAALLRHRCLVLFLPAEACSAFLMQGLVLGFALAAFSGVPPAPTWQLPADADLPMTEDKALLVPACRVSGRLGWPPGRWVSRGARRRAISSSPPASSICHPTRCRPNAGTWFRCSR